MSADVSWSGTATIRAQLSCGSATTSQTSATGAYLSLSAPAGGCSLDLSETPATSAVISYTVFITRQVAVAPGSNG
ncbi:MAG TPA: hypothetical protein VMD59_15225 [Acidimicrobiales bacterium]|nr:hypothetical protein [Acidimicrobiales bacterium]